MPTVSPPIPGSETERFRAVFPCVVQPSTASRLEVLR